LGAGAALGLLQQDPENWFKQTAAHSIDEIHIEALLEARRAARSARDFARADAIRDELTAQGIAIEDSPEGTRWSVIKA
jgi:cysteinyl-tRNA synthetase